MPIFEPMRYLDINVKAGISALLGSLIYFLLLNFPVIPNLSIMIILLTAVSAATVLTVLYFGEDRIDYSNIALIPLAGVIGLGVFITLSSQTVSLLRMIGIYLGPGIGGMVSGLLLFSVSKRVDLNLKRDMKNP